MEQWKKDARREPVITDLEALVSKDHLLRKIEKVMDYDWLYERLNPFYCHDNGRPGIDPVVLIKMVLIQHLFSIPSLRQTYRGIQVNNAYRWFLGYGLLENIPHFATVSYAFCNRFPPELAEEIFDHILNKALNNRMVDPSMVFIDGTHIKACANKKKFQKEKVAQTATRKADTNPGSTNMIRLQMSLPVLTEVFCGIRSQAKTESEATELTPSNAKTARSMQTAGRTKRDRRCCKRIYGRSILTS